MRRFKKAIAYTLGAVMSAATISGVSISTGGVETKAGEDSSIQSGTIYYNFKEITDASDFTQGTDYMFLTQQYSATQSVVSIPTGSAKLNIAGVTDGDKNGNTTVTFTRTGDVVDDYSSFRNVKDTSAYSDSSIKNDWCDKYNSNAQAYVTVMQKGTGFDTCPFGSITYTDNAWHYWCWAGGVKDKNHTPFYCYEFDTETFTSDDVSVTIDGFSHVNETTAKTYSSSEITVVVKIKNQVVDVPYYTLVDGTIDIPNGDNKVTVKVGDVEKTCTVDAHDWVTSANGDTISAYCKQTTNPCKNSGSANALKLTLNVADKTYDGKPATASYGEGEADAWKAATETEAPTITYQVKSGTTWKDLTGAPTEIGKYRAVATYGTGSDALTITKEFSILCNEHDFTGEWTVTKEPTATTEGKKETLCKNGCGTKKVVTIPATGTKEEDPSNGNLDKNAEVAPEAPIDTATLDNSITELMDATGIFSETEKTEIKNGQDAKVYLKISDLDKSKVAEADQTKVETAAEEELGDKFTLEYMDVALFKQIGDADAVTIHEPGEDIEITITIPQNMLLDKKGQVRKYRVIRLHDGKVEVIKGTFNSKTNEFSFTTDKFSTYSIAYSDEAMGIVITTPTGTPETLKPGETVQLDVKVTPEEDADQSVTYKSSNEKVATVDENGLVTAIGEGTVTITVTSADGAVTKDITITVSAVKEDVKTGAGSFVWLWAVVMGTCAGAAATTLVYNKKRKMN